MASSPTRTCSYTETEREVMVPADTGDDSYGMITWWTWPFSPFSLSWTPPLLRTSHLYNPPVTVVALIVLVVSTILTIIAFVIISSSSVLRIIPYGSHTSRASQLLVPSRRIDRLLGKPQQRTYLPRERAPLNFRIWRHDLVRGRVTKRAPLDDKRSRVSSCAGLQCGTATSETSR